MHGHSALIKRGAYLALATAIISGVSIYVNSFGVGRVADPFVFTTAKNVVVAMLLASLVVLPFKLGELRNLSANQWARLATLGLIGGSIPFLLFFYGLGEATAPSAAFMHKTLFIWVGILAVPFLKERLGPLQLGALLTLVVGHLVLVAAPSHWVLGRAELFTLAATLFWAVEAVLARRFMARELSSSVWALGGMGFGSIIMLLFLLLAGRADTFVSMSGEQWGWVLVTAAFLLCYVGGYYGALKRAPATLVTSVLVLGSVITSLLHAIFSARDYTPAQVGGFILVVGASLIWLYVSHRTAERVTAVREAGYAGG